VSEIRVEVVYALPERQYLRNVKLAEGSNVEQAIVASGLLELRRPAKLGDVLNDGDRVEIYRPLIADPKELRRQRAEKAKK